MGGLGVDGLERKVHGLAVHFILFTTKPELDGMKKSGFPLGFNNKLWTMAVALDRLGSQYRWVTQIYAVGKTIGIKGGGDPVFSFSDAVKVAQLLKQRGIRRIERLILDDHSFEALPWGAGWMWDDLAAGYGAPVHAINMEGNRVFFRPILQRMYRISLGALRYQRFMSMLVLLGRISGNRPTN